MTQNIDYFEFLFIYSYYMRAGINTIDNYICIPNDIFDKISRMDLKSYIHRAFVFSCYSTLLLTNSFDNKYSAKNYRRIGKDDYLVYYDLDKPLKEICLSNSQLKEFWGYSKYNKKIDYILKQNGLMDNEGLTEFFIKGYKHIVYRPNRQEGNYFKVPYMVMFYCIHVEELGTIAFTLYALICRSLQLQQANFVPLSGNYFIQILGIDSKTIYGYLTKLENYNLIKANKSIRTDIFGDFISKSTNQYQVVKDLNEVHFDNY